MCMPFSCWSFQPDSLPLNYTHWSSDIDLYDCGKMYVTCTGNVQTMTTISYRVSLSLSLTRNKQRLCRDFKVVMDFSHLLFFYSKDVLFSLLCICFFWGLIACKQDYTKTTEFGGKMHYGSGKKP